MKYFIVKCYTGRVRYTISVLYSTHAEAKEVVRRHKEEDKKDGDFYGKDKLPNTKYKIVSLAQIKKRKTK